MKDRIHTTQNALETLTRDGSTFELGSAHINGCSLPALTYDAEAGTIHSQGGRKFAASAEQMNHAFGTETIITIGDGYGTDEEWTFGSGAKGHEKQRYQTARARALIQHATSELAAA